MSDTMSDIWRGAKGVLGAVAPVLATAMGGPLAGQAVSAIAMALGLGPDTEEQAVAQAVAKASPEQLLALKMADQRFKLEMEKLGVELERIAVEDRSSARKREAAVRDWTPRILGFTIIFGFLYTVWAVMQGSVPNLRDPTTATMVGAVIGYISAKADQVISYYFGSSAGSARKTDQMDRLLSTTGAPPSPTSR
jgi:hypothetical protein